MEFIAKRRKQVSKKAGQGKTIKGDNHDRGKLIKRKSVKEKTSIEKKGKLSKGRPNEEETQ